MILPCMGHSWGTSSVALSHRSGGSTSDWPIWETTLSIPRNFTTAFIHQISCMGAASGGPVSRSLESDLVISKANLVQEASSPISFRPTESQISLFSLTADWRPWKWDTMSSAKPSRTSFFAKSETSPFWKKTVTERKMALSPDILTLHRVLNHLNWNTQEGP